MGRTSITIGDIAIVLIDNDTNVESVGLGLVNGIATGYQRGAIAPFGDPANVMRDGATIYVTGTATGTDPANFLHQIKVPFDIQVTCP